MKSRLDDEEDEPPPEELEGFLLELDELDDELEPLSEDDGFDAAAAALSRAALSRAAF